ncbi:Response regulator [Candidatus Desulfosporosinus infrequens]|uniref:Stage 0 sporulation protein A homolog n=1 Tax=Candidatus Desulfosporosinus infrequens TaxID=2043169 RepID=A0A2U3LXV7_9FIRM|nr:Response regulator [Candidatus Desulfosporosinus infrequens]
MSVNSEELERVKVLVVDDHTLFSEGTVSLLRVESRILAVGIAKNGIECMSFINKTRVDVVLLDINLPDICGVDIIDKIKMVQPEVKILMLTGQDPKGYVTKSISKGANGFLLKSCSVEEMIEAILRVYDGGVYFSQNMAPYIQSAIVGDEIRTEKIIEPEKIYGTSLTAKEIEIIELIAKGLRNREITTALGIKNRTVDFHVSNIMKKLGVKSRLEVALTYMKSKDASGIIS